MHKNRQQAIGAASQANKFGLVLGTLGRQGSPKILQVNRNSTQLYEVCFNFFYHQLYDRFNTGLHMRAWHNWGALTYSDIMLCHRQHFRPKEITK